MKLSRDQFKAISNVVKNTFDQNDLTSLLQLECGRKLAELVALPMLWGPLVTQVVLRAEMEEFTSELVLAVAAWRPRNVALARILRELTEAPGEGTMLALSTTARGLKASNAAALQGMVRAAAAHADFEQFLADVSAAGPRVCRIESADDDDAYGTGFLVADDLVLTNYHVREMLLNANKQAACRFDYRRLANSLGVRGGTVVPAADGDAAWYAWRGYAQSDATDGGALPTPFQLDYALLRLTASIGRFEPGRDDEAARVGTARGYFALNPDVANFVAGQDVLVLQHPAGQPLKLAVGNAIASAIPLRCAHDAPTENGSSGSPCFDIALKLRALHHATDPSDPQRPKFNQAVPIALIAADLAAQGKL